MSEVKRPRLKRIDLEVLKDAVGYFIKSVKQEQAKHEESKTRFSKANKWLQKRERLNWSLLNAKRMRRRIRRLLRRSIGRSSECLDLLLNLGKEDNPGEYIRFIEALQFLPSDNLEDDLSLLRKLLREGIVDCFYDSRKDDSLMVKKIDVLRYSAWLECHKL